MAVPRIISNTAVNAYAAMWCIGFVLTWIGVYFKHPHLKWAGFVLLVPFSIYLVVITVLSIIAFVRGVRENRRHR